VHVHPPSIDEAELERAAVRVHETSMDLTKESSVALHVFPREPGDYVVMLRFHHLFHDHGSTDMLHAELFEAYEAERAGTRLEWPPVPFDFDEYVSRETTFRGSPEASRALEFFRERLADAPYDHELPTDLASFAKERRGATLTTRLACRDQVRECATKTGLSRHRVLLAAYLVLLSRWSGRYDFTVGTPADCRSRDMAGVAGYFVNLVPFRFKFSQDISFRDLLRLVDDELRATLPHRFLPLVDLVEKLWDRSGSGLAPFCRTTFALTKTDRCPTLDRPQMSRHLPWQKRQGSLLLETPPDCPQQEGHFDLSFWLWDLESEGLGLEVKYDPQLFSTAAAERMARQYEGLLTSLVSDPDRSIGAHPLFADSATVSARSALRPEKLGPFEPAHAAFLRNAEASPESDCIRFSGSTWSYGRVRRLAFGIAEVLIARGVAPGELVPVVSDKRPEAVAAYLGVLLAGAAFVAVDASYPRERIELMLEESRARIVLVSSWHRSLVGKDANELIELDEASLSTSGTVTPPSVDEQALAYVIFTSGSTGRPKGVLIEHRGVCQLARTLVGDWSLDSSGVVFAFAPFSFDACIADIFPTFAAGAVLHLGEEPQPSSGHYLSSFMEREGITHVTLPPSVWLSMGDVSLSSLRVAVSAGEACPAEVVTKWGVGRRFFNNYGPTEITVCASTKRIELTSAEAPVIVNPSIGKIVPGVRARVVDSYGHDQPVSVVGELWLGGEGIARGYLGREDLTAERFVDTSEGRYYRTGDRVRLRPDGELDYIGRADEQVKIRGFRVELTEVEEGLRRAAEVSDVAVAARILGGRLVLVAYVVGDMTELMVRARETLPRHLLPSLYQSVDALPRAPSGKVDRARLPAPVADITASEPLRGERELVVGTVFREIVGLETIGPNDDFFEIGGDSLSAVRALFALEARLGEKFPPDALLQHRTVRSLAAFRPSDMGASLVDLGGQGGVGWVLVPPAGGDGTAYRHLVDALARHGSVRLLRPGLGKDSTLSGLARRMADVLARSDSRIDVLVGWSFGGVLAQEVARCLDPSKAPCLVLLDSSPTLPTLASRPERDDETMAHHVNLYAAHHVEPANCGAWVAWARAGVDAEGAWNMKCRVLSERSFEATHDSLLRPPIVSEVVSWLAELGESVLKIDR
jgi:amino acid adenylation domain-containing protein